MSAAPSLDFTSGGDFNGTVKIVAHLMSLLEIARDKLHSYCSKSLVARLRISPRLIERVQLVISSVFYHCRVSDVTGNRLRPSWGICCVVLYVVIYSAYTWVSNSSTTVKLQEDMKNLHSPLDQEHVCRIGIWYLFSDCVYPSVV